MTLATDKLGVNPIQVKALGITNQRETTVVWNRHTGEPLHNAIVWQDLRTHATCSALRAEHDNERVRSITGLPISTYFSGVKLRWLFDNVPAVAAAVRAGDALFGTIDTWLVWHLTRERAHVTDVTNAGRTMLMDVEKLEWADEMLRMLDVPRAMLPEIRACGGDFGTLRDTSLRGTRVSGVIGDQQSALVGQACFSAGDAKSTYGTGCFLIVNTGPRPHRSLNGLLTTPAYQLTESEPCMYALEGSVAVAGSAVTWMRDGLGLLSSAAESEEAACGVEDAGGVCFVPALTGLFAPWWREDARGALFGLTQFSTRGHIVRALLDGVAFMVDAVLQAAASDMRAPLAELKVDGGMTANNLLMQLQADITGTPVARPTVTETTAMGAAFVAGHASGVFASLDELRTVWRLDRRFEPRTTAEERAKRTGRWHKAVARSLDWAESDDIGNGGGRESTLSSSQPKPVEEPDIATRSNTLTKGLEGALDHGMDLGFATGVLLGAIGAIVFARMTKSK